MHNLSLIESRKVFGGSGTSEPDEEVVVRDDDGGGYIDTGEE